MGEGCEGNDHDVEDKKQRRTSIASRANGGRGWGRSKSWITREFN